MSSQYLPIKQTDVEQDGRMRQEPSKQKTNAKSVLVTIFLVSVTAVSSFILGGQWKHKSLPRPLPRPVGGLEWTQELASLPTSLIRFEGSFRFENNYRGPPSPEIDKAWARYTEHPLIAGTASLISVQRDDIQRSHKTDVGDWVNATVNLGDVNGGGYMATLEVFHQLHCLNMLRKYVHIDYYRNVDRLFDGSSQDTLMTHLDHCIEILRQVLSCNADTGLIVFKWVKGNPVPYPDFNTWHQCRDAEQVLQWSREREAPIVERVRKELFEDVVEMTFAP